MNQTCGFCGAAREAVTVLIAAERTAVCAACVARLVEVVQVVGGDDPGTSSEPFGVCVFCGGTEGPRIVGSERIEGHPDPVICHGCVATAAQALGGQT
ncbi:MAG: hypothetical protein O2816_03745 [Planctomycetota bacterium]|nr:hypothetical protein [Planctomycetota bacterium]